MANDKHPALVWRESTDPGPLAQLLHTAGVTRVRVVQWAAKAAGYNDQVEFGREEGSVQNGLLGRAYRMHIDVPQDTRRKAMGQLAYQRTKHRANLTRAAERTIMLAVAKSPDRQNFGHWVPALFSQVCVALAMTSMGIDTRGEGWLGGVTFEKWDAARLEGANILRAGFAWDEIARLRATRTLERQEQNFERKCAAGEALPHQKPEFEGDDWSVETAVMTLVLDAFEPNRRKHERRERIRALLDEERSTFPDLAYKISAAVSEVVSKGRLATDGQSALAHVFGHRVEQALLGHA